MPFVCSECSYHSIKWLGRCPKCGLWDSFVQENEAEVDDASASWIDGRLQAINDIDLAETKRLHCKIEEVDHLLGGGLIPGSVILFGGEPGVGKSTLLLQISRSIAQQHGNVLYVSGEESPAQLKLRATRLGVNEEKLFVLSEQSLSRVLQAVDKIKPKILIVDSIQAVICDGVSGDAGSVRQLRAASSQLARVSKLRKMPTFLVGHITKEGSFAGPKTVEHLVDVAIYLEGRQGEDIRILRSVKNRFGGTNEVAVFQMGEKGLQQITNPSQFFLENHRSEPRPGTVVVPTLEGSRPILVELQALVSPTGGFHSPQRRTSGLDYNRILLLLAVIERRLGINTGGADVYLSIAGGLETKERATDLGVVAAVVSSLRDRPVSNRTAVVGEVGLSGEIRNVRKLRDRISEAEKLGYNQIIVPAASKARRRKNVDVVAVDTINQAIENLLLD